VADESSRMLLFDVGDVARYAAKAWRDDEQRNGGVDPGPLAVLRAIEVLVEERYYQAACQLVFLSVINTDTKKGEARKATEALAAFDRSQQFLAAYLTERATGPESN
jgi:hypothetical protein